MTLRVNFLITLALLGSSSLSSAAQLDPANMCRAGTGRFATDYTVCTAAIASGKHNGVALTSLLQHRAKALRYMNECAAALKDINSAVATTDWSVAAWTERARINQCNGNMSESLQDADRAIALNQFDFESWRQRGIALFYLGRYADADQSLSRSIELNAYNAEAHAFRGLAAFGDARYEDAAWDFNNVVDQRYAWDMAAPWLYLSIRLSQRDPTTMLADALERTGDIWPGALLQWLASPGDAAALRDAATKVDKLPSALFFIAHEAHQRNDLKQAKALFEEILGNISKRVGQPVVEGVLARRALEKL